MNVRTASLFALIGTILMAILSVARFVQYFMNSLNGLVASAMVLSALIQAIAWITLVVFFFVFYRRQA